MLKNIVVLVSILIFSTHPALAAKGKLKPAEDRPEQSGYTVVVPSEGLPPEAVPQNANNNLDVVRHNGRVFLAFRTGPTHFASTKTELYIVSSTDQENWDFEARFHRNTDLREPRFLSYDGKLFLYFAVLGVSTYDFAPKGMMLSQYNGPGNWSEPEWFLEKGFIPWRTKVIGGKPYMMAYHGGENLYNFEEGDTEDLHWLTTTDGREWTAVVPGQPIVYTGGCSETDFEFADDGAVIAVCRNELGDAQGFGSKICRAEPDSPGDWKCKPDPKKYDSPLVFKNGSDIYLVGRRNISKTGNFDLGRDKKSFKQRALAYQLDYWKRPKRCSLWRVHPDTLTVSYVDDLPSKGDTCFASVIPMGENQFMLYNYTSPPDGPDISWNQAQQGHTLIYKILLTFKD